MRSPGGRELSLSTCPGVGNRPPSESKIANPRGGMVTGRIEPCINSTASFPLVLLLLVGCFLAKRSVPREKFGSSSLVSSIDCRKVQQQELAAKLDGNFAAKLNAIAHVMLYTHGRAYIEIYAMMVQ